MSVSNAKLFAENKYKKGYFAAISLADLQDS